ncbi:FAD-binding oxidoreductase [Marinibaculum pumilum]|uniref:FAD-binding oxidoreductase n=1 Tax=Marinibaculum pumilum TaxID=1766165 RepID=A0ABV7KXN1_9PROT
MTVPNRSPVAAAPTAEEAAGDGLSTLLGRIEGRRARARHRLAQAELASAPADGAGRPSRVATPAGGGQSGDRPADGSLGIGGLRRMPPLAVDTGSGRPATGSVAGSASGAAAEPEVRVPAGAAPGTVLMVQNVAPGLLRFALARPPGFSYAAGQSVKLSLGGISRRYTMVSAPHQPYLEFFVELVPGGRMSAHLAGLRRGNRVDLAGGPKGGIALDGSARRHLMLATVTGVNPFVSILRDAVQRGRTDLGAVLVQGASHADEFGYRAELEAMAAAHPQLLSYIPTVSRPGESRNAGWSGATGRADARIADTLQRFALHAADTAAYACGNPGMVDTARRRLSDLGFAVRVERYD